MATKSLATLVKNAEAALGIEIVIHGRRAAHYAEETGEGYWLTREDLAYAADCRREYPHDTYSHWCSGTTVRQMSERARLEIFGR